MIGSDASIFGVRSGWASTRRCCCFFLDNVKIDGSLSEKKGRRVKLTARLVLSWFLG